MTPTSEERREVAERLRKAADSDEWLDLTIENAIFGVFGEVRRPAADTLADLIEPPDTDGILDAKTTGRIVRCRDCAFFGRSEESDWLPWCWRDPDHTGHGWPTNESGYCAWGRRADG